MSKDVFVFVFWSFLGCGVGGRFGRVGLKRCGLMRCSEVSFEEMRSKKVDSIFNKFLFQTTKSQEKRKKKEQLI